MCFFLVFSTLFYFFSASIITIIDVSFDDDNKTHSHVQMINLALAISSPPPLLALPLFDSDDRLIIIRWMATCESLSLVVVTLKVLHFYFETRKYKLPDE